MLSDRQEMNPQGFWDDLYSLQEQMGRLLHTCEVFPRKTSGNFVIREKDTKLVSHTPADTYSLVGLKGRFSKNPFRNKGYVYICPDTSYCWRGEFPTQMLIRSFIHNLSSKHSQDKVWRCS